ncbi:MAG: hypothetical protein M1827_000220 [Pycnora praestabilis]|nr:MAG: hypothetical protein M1827_000220 [Pycnora praestabilis]
MVDNRGPTYHLPHRKPVPALIAGNGQIRPLTQIVPDSQLPTPQQQQSTSTSQSRDRTSSSSLSSKAPPISSYSSSPHTASPVSYHNMANQYAPARRTLSNATASTSTTGTGSGLIPARTNSTVSVTLRRSTSSRSGNSPGGYVALMRKQKATVWCDRSQHEDPRLVAQQKAAKMRAVMEVVGGGNTAAGRTSTSGSGSMLGHSVVRSKIRHHGAQKMMGYTPGSLVGGGVPMRLSASEVGDEAKDEDGDSQYAGGPYHQRTGSGRSSVGSNRRHTTLNYRTASTGRYSQNITPPSGQDSSPSEGMPDLTETPVPNQQSRPADYFTQSSGTGISGGSGSGSSGDRENSFGNVTQMAAPHGNSANLGREKSVKSQEELRRRGSVDDRTMTMSGVRLFVANPDLSD